MRLRRPLCAAVLLFVLTVRILLAVCPPEAPSVPDGRLAEADGRIEKIERSGTEENSWRLTIRAVSVRVLPEGRETDPGGKILCEIRGRQSRDGDSGADAAPNGGLRIGQTVTVKGRCRRFAGATNPGQFDASLYYRILGYSFRMRNARITEATDTYYPLRDGLARLRAFLSECVGQCVSSKEAALVRAVLLGERCGEPMQRDLFEGVGLFRLLGVSSLQIALLGTALFSLLRKRGLPVWAASAAAGAAVLLYAQMTGGGVAVARAAMMFAYRMTARMVRRTPDLLTGTALAVFLLLWQQPLYLLYDGFLYSVTAVLAAAILVPAARNRVQTAAAVPLAVLPLQMRTAGMLSVYSTGMYLLAVPAVTIVVLSGGAALLPAAVSNLLADILGAQGAQGAAGDSFFLPVCTALMLTARAAALPAELVLRGMSALSLFLARLPGYAVITGRPGLVQTGGYGMLLLLQAVPEMQARREEHARRRHMHLVLRSAVLLAAALCALFVRMPVRGMEIDFLDVGQGDGILLRTGDVTVLIDGGSSSAGEIGETVLLPFLRTEGVRRLDAVVLTHPDLDHCNGMLTILEGAEGPIPEREDGSAVLPNGLEVGVLLLPDLDESLRTEQYRALEETALIKGIPVRRLARGDTLSAGDLLLTCLHPEPGGAYESTNAGSTVLLAQYRDFSCLLTGDLERDGEETCLEYIRSRPDLCAAAARLTCLKAAHHGSRFATGEAWLSVIDAQIAVISCGRDNLYGHPAPETVKRLRQDGSVIWTTAEKGCVRLRTDGETAGIVFGTANWYH